MENVEEAVGYFQSLANLKMLVINLSGLSSVEKCGRNWQDLSVGGICYGV